MALDSYNCVSVDCIFPALFLYSQLNNSPHHKGKTFEKCSKVFMFVIIFCVDLKLDFLSIT